eukprot:3515377-Lingulodinium_polyedra.AAC.1
MEPGTATPPRGTKALSRGSMAHPPGSGLASSSGSFVVAEPLAQSIAAGRRPPDARPPGWPRH